MFNSPVLDLAITLSFTYFILSLIVSSFNEFIYSFISRRGKMLKQSICSLLFDDPNENNKWSAFVDDKIYSSPQIQSLQKKKDEFPSYIPASNFAIALIESMRKGNKLMNMNDIKSYLLDTDKTNALPEKLRLTLLPMFERAQGDLQNFQSQIEAFYNNAMDRVTGWYKRETSLVIFIIGILICGLGNVDTINITRKLWGDPDKLKLTAGNIANLSTNIKYNENSKDFSTTSKVDSLAFQGISGSYEVTQVDTQNKTQKKITVNLDNALKAANNLSASGIPFGWNGGNGMKNKFCLHTGPAILELLIKLSGWLITAFAITLGAPFWFDLMNKFINLRGTGKKPDEGNSGNGSNTNASNNSSTQNAVG